MTWGDARQIFLVTAGLAVVIGIGLVVKRPSRNPTIAEATRLISSEILLTRQKAMAGETPYRVQYDHDRREFRIYRETAPGRWEIDPDTEPCRLPSGVTLARGDFPAGNALDIDTGGRIDAAEFPVVFKLRDENNVRVTIRVSESGVVQELAGW